MGIEGIWGGLAFILGWVTGFLCCWWMQVDIKRTTDKALERIRNEPQSIPRTGNRRRH